MGIIPMKVKQLMEDGKTYVRTSDKQAIEMCINSAKARGFEVYEFELGVETLLELAI